MVYDTFVAGEVQAANGLTLTTVKGPPTHTIVGDTILVKKAIGKPVMFGIGSTSDTKPQGCAWLPSISNRAVNISGPGALAFADQGWTDMRLSGVKRLSEGETLSALVSNTNVNEGAVVGANIGYGGFPPIMGPMGDINVFYETVTITSAADVTYNSGAVPIEDATTSSTWLDTEGKYQLLGVVGQIGVATGGGLLCVSGLGGGWEAKFPGLPINSLSDVTFTPAQPWTPFPEPIPFDGDATCSVGMTSSTAAAVTFVMVIRKM